MRNLVRFASLCGVFAASAIAPAAAADRTVEIPLGAMGSSTEHGTATLRAQGDKTVVVLKLQNAPDDPQPAHFHTGTCDNYTPRPLYPLKNVVHGESTTTLEVPIDTLLKGDLVLNVHHSLTDIATVATCGVAKAP